MMDRFDAGGQGFKNPAIAGDSEPRGEGAPERRKLQTAGRWITHHPRPTTFELAGAFKCADHLTQYAGDWLTPGLDQSGEHQRLVLVGPAPWEGLDGSARFSIAAVREWAALTFQACERGWVEADQGHYLHGAYPTLRYVHRSGFRLEVIRAAQWFGEGGYSPELAREAWYLLGARVGDVFDGGVLLSTPATTGRDLFLRSLGGRTYDVLSDDAQELIRSTSGQGRVELFGPELNVERHGTDRLARLTEYDGRMMYAGCLSELPAGTMYYDREPDFLGYTRARYRVQFQVPSDWQGPGLLGVQDDYGWRWPNQPGETGECWADGVEVQLALRHDWHLSIHERMYWPEPGRPLDTWAAKLLRCLSDLPVSTVDGLIRAGVRAIILHGVGALYGRGHKVTRSTTDPSEVPAGAVDVDWDGEGTYTYAVVQGQRWPELAHPEWSAAVWARARARLLDCPTGVGRIRAGMLHVDPATLVACRTDAIYTTTDPRWPEDGGVGRLSFRHSWGPLDAPWPTSQAELLSLRDHLTSEPALIDIGPDDLSSSTANGSMH